MLKEIGEKTKVRTAFHVDILRAGVLECDSKVIPKTFVSVCIHSVCLAGVGGDRANCATGRG